ncbi:MAG TPA: N-acetyl-gamma-glutamyl-phosphate reductase [Bacteroidia bacterium]|jgi:N-acetyl-gamma-glutamyl-phosphate reductase
MKKTNVSVIGASGYAGGELIRLLVHHPDIELVSAVSSSKAGMQLTKVFPDLLGETDLSFSDVSDPTAEIIFLCLQHGAASAYLNKHPELLSKKIIDLSRDFRLAAHDAAKVSPFVYGLPELNKAQICNSKYVANPGCFATGIQLGLLPLAKHQLLKGDIHVNAITGSTGAGIKATATTHFSWRQNNISVYNAFAHPHNAEILESIRMLQPAFGDGFLFVPQRGSFTRGIFATMIIQTEKTERELLELYENYYQEQPFTHLQENDIDLKMVVNTNKCFINIKKSGRHLLITTVIDNLLKGAAGQAVQNMNLMSGFAEQSGLTLKANVF